MILEACNETLHNGVPEFHRQEFSYSAGVSDSSCNITPCWNTSFLTVYKI